MTNSSNFWENKTVFVTGGGGLLGNAVTNLLRDLKANFYAPSSKDYDFKEKNHCWMAMAAHPMNNKKYDVVFHLAAKVGGINANTTQVGDFYNENILINTNVLDRCKTNSIPRVISVLSTCIYPDVSYVKYPLTEDQLHMGPPHESNFGYAYAKRMLEIQSRAYRKQYGCDYITAIPNNMFGNYDNFDLENGHVIPSLMRRILEAKINKQPTVKIWGDGTPLREFTYSKDVAKILLLLAETYHEPEPINIGCTQEYSISYVARTIANLLEYKGDLIFDSSKPNGQYRKPSSNAKLLEKTSWTNDKYTSFEQALKETCKWFISMYPYVRGVK